jgi:hypothetical protein
MRNGDELSANERALRDALRDVHMSRGVEPDRERAIARAGRLVGSLRLAQSVRYELIAGVPRNRKPASAEHRRAQARARAIVAGYEDGLREVQAALCRVAAFVFAASRVLAGREIEKDRVILMLERGNVPDDAIRSLVYVACVRCGAPEPGEEKCVHCRRIDMLDVLRARALVAVQAVQEAVAVLCEDVPERDMVLLACDRSVAAFQPGLFPWVGGVRR